MIEHTIPVSPDQEDVIVDHVFKGTELGVVADEKVWILNHARKEYPGCKVLGADLDITKLQWNLKLELRPDL